MPRIEGQFVGSRHLMWFLLAAICVAAGIASLYLNSFIIIAAIFLLLNVVLVMKYPMWGLLAYLVIFLMRPGEVFPALAPLRVELLTGIFVMVAVILQQKLIEKRVTFPSDKITISLVALLAVMCLTIFVSYEKSYTFQTIQDFIKLIIFYYLIVTIVNTRKNFVTFVSVFLIMITYIAYDAFKMYLAGGFIHTMNVDRLYGSTSAGGDPNTLASTLASTIPFVIASGYYFRNVFIKILLFVLAAFMAGLITITASRGGMIAFLGVVLGGIAFSRHKFVAIVALVIVLSAGWTVLPDQYKERYETLGDVEDIDQTSSGRWEIWKSGFNMIVNRPILGVGAGAFVTANGSGDFGPPRFMQSHNLYIQVFATTGIIGFAVWLAFIFNVIQKLRVLRNKVAAIAKLRWIRVYSTSFAVSLIALFISGMFAHNLYRYTWYMMAALIVVLSNLAGPALSEDGVVADQEREKLQIK